MSLGRTKRHGHLREATEIVEAWVARVTPVTALPPHSLYVS